METLLEMEGEIFCSVASSDEVNGLYAGSIAIAILLVSMYKCLNLIEEKLLIVVSTSLEEWTVSEGLSWLTLQENVSHVPSPNVKFPF